MELNIDESFELIKEVLNNRTENRAYNYYLSTLIFNLFSKEKTISYSEFKRKLFKNKIKIKKMTEEEKETIINKNNNILKNIKAGE
ncbi:hypothetical protein [Intestinibacter bartlettii]|uniref:hypothetical protein n=1 Tax=Intestinibacter bartlettii TaxID=261299 RepID=UPI00082338F5|nr:hypothetical protein [Intestinibacter bartlettii]SCJ12079.1 Uncharacterised protein [uncultured Clostridium sp.]